MERSHIDWAEVLAFLELQEPGIGVGIVGATDAQIKQLQARSPVPLPEAYIGFMRCFGGARGDFNVMPEHCYLADELLSIPEDIYIWDRQRYLLIGMLDESPRLDTHELFLDLQMGDSQDALMVGFTPGEDPVVYELECGISDCVVFRAMWWYAMEREAVIAQLLYGSIEEPNKKWVWERVRFTVEVFEQLGFARCLPDTPYTWCGRRGESEYCVVHGEAEDDTVFVDVAGEEERAVLRVAAVFEDVAGAELRRVVRNQ